MAVLTHALVVDKPAAAAQVSGPHGGRSAHQLNIRANAGTGHERCTLVLPEIVRAVAEQVFSDHGTRVEYLVGTMIELPRAALTASELARLAEFFSFGTNDLTQTSMGLSRDDSGRFLPGYVQRGIFGDDPFQRLDVEGVGQLVQLGTERGRAARSDLKVGVCGEHGGDPPSIAFFHDLSLDYVSCSPYRVPVARLAAAQAALHN